MDNKMFKQQTKSWYYMTGQQADIKKRMSGANESNDKATHSFSFWELLYCWWWQWFSVRSGFIYILLFRDGGNIWESMVDGRCGGINGDGYYCDSIAATVTAML